MHARNEVPGTKKELRKGVLRKIGLSYKIVIIMKMKREVLHYFHNTSSVHTSKSGRSRKITRHGEINSKL